MVEWFPDSSPLPLRLPSDLFGRSAAYDDPEATWFSWAIFSRHQQMTKTYQNTNHWLVVSNMNFIFHFIYGIYNPSHWLTHIFQRGRYTTNQIIFSMYFGSQKVRRLRRKNMFPRQSRQRLRRRCCQPVDRRDEQRMRSISSFIRRGLPLHHWVEKNEEGYIYIIIYIWGYIDIIIYIYMDIWFSVLVGYSDRVGVLRHLSNIMISHSSHSTGLERLPDRAPTWRSKGRGRNRSWSSDEQWWAVMSSG